MASEGRGGNRWLATGLLVVVGLLVIAAADRSDARWDLSADRRHTIHPRLHELAAATMDPVEVLSIWRSPPEDRWLAMIADPIQNRLQRIAATVDGIVYHHIDPSLDRGLLAEYQQRHGTLPHPALVVLVGDRPPERLALSHDTPRTLERDLGTVLASDAERTPLYYSLGHGELRPDASGDDGSGRLLEAARLAGFDPLPLAPGRMAELGRIPDDGVLAILGSTAPWDPTNLQMLDAYLESGGAALLLLDHRAPPALANLVRTHGIVAGSAWPDGLREQPALLLRESIADTPTILQSLTRARTTARGQGRERLLLLGDDISATSPMTARTKRSGRYCLSPWTTPLLIAHPQGVPEGLTARLITAYRQWGTAPFRAEPLLSLPGEAAWRQPITRLDILPEEPQTPPQHLLAAQLEYSLSDSASGRTSGRLVVWGSRQAAADATLDAGIYANDLLLTDMLSWLARREPISDIPPTRLRAYQVDADDTTWRWIQIGLLLILPGLFLGAAMLTWWDRR